MTTFQGTNTYLIECSRENSKINVDDDINTNGAWSNETEFGLKRGDRISVEMVCANIRGSGTGAPTIEFSGQNVVVNGEDKGYCDTKVLIEVFFTMNNNNTYSVGLPLIHPKGGINGRGFPGGTQDFDNLVMPFNLNPRIPAGTTNQINNYREINAGDGYVYPVLDSIGRVVPAVNQLTTPPQVGAPSGGAYCVYQWKTVNGGWLPPGTDLADYLTEGRLEAIRLLPFASTQTTPAQPAAEIPFQATRFTDFDNGILKGRTGSHVQNNFYVGNHVWVSDEDPTAVGDYGSYWCGEISEIRGFSPLGTPAFGIGVVELYFSMSNNVPSAKYPNYGGRTGGGTGAPGLPWAGGARCACYVGDLYIDNAGNPFASFNLKAGSSQEGLINYDNLCMNETPFDSPATGATGRTFKPNGYHRGNNGHFLYARNTRVPQTGQNPDLNHFPLTEFDPTTVSGSSDAFYTSTAGEYGDLPAGANFGYRNANIVEECNNNPYIFMRNDHFGAGRLGMNGEKMPKAEPMTAFIYVTINELLQDVNSLTAVINQRLQESLTGIGTTIPQTNDLLLNSLENPDGRQVASNVIPYYNRIGFYDRFVTTDSQNTLMNQSLNAQFRNEITDIIPVKNGGTVKVTPANGTSGRDQLACNYGKQFRGIPQLRLGATYADSETPTQEELDTVKKNTYLREIETSFSLNSTPAVPGTNELDLVEINGFNGWANPFYGNMATADLYKYLLGDRWAALPVHNLNNLTGDGGNKFRDVGKAIIMNTQFNYQVYNFPYPAGTNDYGTYLSTFPNCTPKPLNTTILYENQLIYTNIEFPTEDDEDQTWAALAKQMRKYETYYNISATAPSTYKLQVADTDNWIFDGDVGMTDDRSTAQLRTMTGQPTYHPPNVYPDTGSAPDNQAKYSDNRPAYYDWLANPEPAAVAVTATNSALGVTASNFQVTSPGRDLICPTTSHEVFAGVSATSNMDYEEKYRFMKQLGRLKLKSRFNKNFANVMKNYKGLEIALGDALPPEPHDADFRAANNPNDPDAKIDTTFMEALDLGFYPYFREVQEFDVASDSMKTVKKVFCALAVGTFYTDKNYADLATVNIGCLVWGNQIGISNSFYDNHAIIPMNNDQVKRDAQLTKTTVTPGSWERIAYINAVDMFAGTLPTAVGDLAYTTASVDPPFKDNSYDFTVNRQADPIYQGSDGKCLYRITYSGQSLGSGIDSMQGTWKQNTNLQDAAVGGYEWISGDSYFTDTSSTSPGQMPFLGLQLNASQNTSDNPWLLSTPPPNNVINSSPAWSCFPVINTGGVDPNDPPSTLPYYDGHPGCKQIGYTNTTFPLFGSVEIEIFKQPTTTNVGDPIEPNLGLQPNKVNYVWTGATKPTFQYDPTKGRCEFVQLQDDNILNVKSIPYTDKSAAQTTAASVGTKAAIINSASEDAVYSRNSTVEDLANPTKSKPVRNSGVRAEISAVGIYNIFLCPENYEPPPTINLSSYWDNRVSDSGDYWKKTEENRQKIIATCIEASESNWAGSLFARLGFQSHRELLPVYGKQKNRFNPNTYNTTDPDKISRASKPLILCNAIDNSIMPALNTYFTFKDATAVADQINGVPMYSNGFLNNESVSIDVQNQALTASSPPILSTSPFLLIESDICQTNWRSGRTQQNVLFYLMKNYQASSFIYGYGSSYTHTVNQDRNLSLIHTAFRDPITGRLQKCSNNSTIIYKIERDIVVPPPTTDVNGTPLNIEPPQSEEDQLLKQIMQNTSRGNGNTGEGGRAPVRGGDRSSGGGGISNINRQMVDADLIANNPVPGIGEVQLGNRFMGAPPVDSAGRLLGSAIAFDTTIAPAMGVDPAEADIVAFVIQQILQTYPLDLVYSGGELMPSLFEGLSPADGTEQVSNQMINYVLQTIDQMGGIETILRFYDDPDTDGTQKLAELINRSTLNNEGELVNLDNPDYDGETALATFSITGDGARSLAELSSAVLRFYQRPDGSYENFNKNTELNPEQVQILDQMVAVFTQTLYEDGVTLTDPMGEFTGIPFRANARLDGMVSVDRAATIPGEVIEQEGTKEPEERRGRSRTRRKSRFEPIDAFQRRQRSEAAEKRSGGETKEETKQQESKTEPKRERKKFTPDFDTSQRRSRARSLTSRTAERRREANIRLKRRRRGGATTPAETSPDSFERTPPRYSNTPVRMRSLTPTRPPGSGQGIRARSQPPSVRE